VGKDTRLVGIVFAQAAAERELEPDCCELVSDFGVLALEVRQFSRDRFHVALTVVPA
jgi:hypothetical protein